MDSSTSFSRYIAQPKRTDFATAPCPERKSAPRKLSLKGLGRQLRRAILTLTFVLVHAFLPLNLIGWLNRRYGFIHSLFVCYPASNRFSKHYVLDVLIEHLRWRVAIYGVFFQGGKLGVLMATSTTEREFTRRTNGEQLERLQHSVDEMQRRLGVSKVNYAGVLPHYMREGRDADAPAQTKSSGAAVAALVFDAYVKVAEKEQLETPPVILLGGLGAVGGQLDRELKQRGIEVHVVDKRLGGGAWPKHLTGQGCVLIDVARRGARADYIDQFWPELVYLNETYPEPRGRELDRLVKVGMKVHHVVGIQGTAFPAFPYGYRGGVPCCAMHRPEDARVVVQELS